MDQFRAMAYLDLMNDVSAEARIAAGPPEEGLGAPGEAAFRDEPEPDDPGAPAPERSGGSDCPCNECDGKCAPYDDDGDSGPEDGEPGDDGNGEPDDGEPDDGGGGPGDDEPDGRGPDEVGRQGPLPAQPPSPRPHSPAPPQPPPAPPQSPAGPSSPWSTPPSSPAPPKPTDLTIPLATLLGPPTRPGESHGFGPLDPALCRALAALAATSPHTTACVTVTDDNGYAIGHGCFTTGRGGAQLPGAPAPPLTALPSRLNLTITATRLAKLLRDAHPPRQPPPDRPRIADRLGPDPARRRPRPAPPATPAGPAPERGDPLPNAPAGVPALVRHLRLRPPPGVAHLRGQRHAPPPGPDPRLRVHPPDLLPPRERQRLRARRPLRPGRTNVRLQRRSPLPRLPPGQTGTRLESHPAQTRLAPMGNPVRPDLHPRTQAIPRLTRRRPGAEAAGPRPGRPARTPAGGVPRSARARECRGPQRR